MGKKIIIKGADFSANAIYVANLDIQSKCERLFKVGVGIVNNDNTLEESLYPNRASVFFLNLLEYYNQGYRTVKVNVNNSIYDTVFIIGSSVNDFNVYDENGDIATWVWLNKTSLQGPITGNVYLSLNFRRSDNTNIPSNVEFDDIITSIELL